MPLTNFPNGVGADSSNYINEDGLVVESATIDSATIGGSTVNTPVTASVALAAGAATDEMDIFITVLPARVHFLEVWITDSAAAMTITGTSASGALTAVTGGIISAHTAKKHVTCVTAATGIINLSLVDSANTAGEVICVRMPDGTIVQSAASAATDYEGGS